MRSEYLCPKDGPFESTLGSEVAVCRCGRRAKRVWNVAINRTSLKSEARWDPVVGEYVRSNREFDYKLAQGVEAQCEKLNMDVVVEKFDPRDRDGIEAAHGWKDTAADLEPA